MVKGKTSKVERGIDKKITTPNDEPMKSSRIKKLLLKILIPVISGLILLLITTYILNNESSGKKVEYSIKNTSENKFNNNGNFRNNVNNSNNVSNSYNKNNSNLTNYNIEEFNVYLKETAEQLESKNNTSFRANYQVICEKDDVFLPVSNAIVTIVYLDCNSEKEIVECDVQGKFVIHYPANVEYINVAIKIEKSGYSDYNDTLKLKNGKIKSFKMHSN